MFAESFLYSLEVAVASRSCDGRQEGRVRSVRVEELEDPGRVDRGGQGQDSSIRKFISCNQQCNVIKLGRLTHLFIYSRPLEDLAWTMTWMTKITPTVMYWC